jgi:hypothetical protein
VTVWNEQVQREGDAEAVRPALRALGYRSGLDDVRPIRWQRIVVGVLAMGWALFNFVLGAALAAFTVDSLMHLRWGIEDLVVPCSAFSTVFFLALAWDAVRSARNSFAQARVG